MNLSPGSCCALVAGQRVHAGVRLIAHDHVRLERPALYAGRPPLAMERLSLLPDGRLLYRLKRRWRDGTTHVIYEPLELLERLTALVPPPRFHSVKYPDILAPSAAWRLLVVPEPPACDATMHRNCPAVAGNAVNANKNGDYRPRNYSRQLFPQVLGCIRIPGAHRHQRPAAGFSNSSTIQPAP
jgi:hypothetical protein